MHWPHRPVRESQVDANLERVSAAQAGILRYLRAHPESSDSVEGIQRWWLADANGSFEEFEVRAAVERLLRSGHVQRRSLPDGCEVYAGGAAP